MAVPTAALVLGVVTGLTGLTGCSGDDADKPDEEPSGSTATEHRGIDTTVEVGDVVGRLGKGPARDVAAKVAKVVDTWIDGAYVGGDFPRARFGDAFAGFTEDAAALATRQKALMSNATVGDKVDEVTAVRRVVKVDLLAPKGEAAGATARVNLVMRLSGDVTRTEQVRGRLALTPATGGWRIFAFDVDRGEVRR